MIKIVTEVYKVKMIKVMKMIKVFLSEIEPDVKNADDNNESESAYFSGVFLRHA